MKALGCSLVCLWLAGCAGAQKDANLGTTRDLAVDQEPEEKHGKRPVSKLDPEVVARAAMPFVGVRTEDGERLAPEELLRQLAEADVICVGEDHDNPHHHWAQLRILRGLVARAPMRAREVAIGMEMVDRERQPALDKYLAWEIEEEELIDELEWHERWGYDWAFYRPLAELGRRARLRLVALNAPRELVQKIARGGVEGLDEDEEKALPELDLGSAEHRAWFDRAMHDHPPPVSDKDRMYTAQVLWDESMADATADWLDGHLPLRQMLVLAGAGHCHDAAIPARVRRRVPARTLSVRPVIGDPEKLGSELAGFDYGFVMTPES